MITSATLKFVRMSPRKARLVADQVRGMRVEQAVNLLNFHNKRAAALIKKVVNSAIANAENNESADIDELKIDRIFVDQGPVLKRFRARAKGRGNRILKPTCHITVAVSDNERN